MRVVVERVDVWVWFEDVAGVGVDGDGEDDDVPAPEDIGIEEVGERGFGSLGVIERVIACTLLRLIISTPFIKLLFPPAQQWTN